MTNQQAESQTNFIRREKSKFVFNCLHCNKEFVSPGYEVRAGRMNKYCSNHCQAVSPKRVKNVIKSLVGVDRSREKNYNWKNGVSHQVTYSFRKDTCELCGTTNKSKKRSLIAHHLDKNRNNNVIENIKTVCYSCHQKIHTRCYYGKYPKFQKW